jgi:hypothetical protein
VSGNKNGRSGRPKYLKLMFEESREKVNLKMEFLRIPLFYFVINAQLLCIMYFILHNKDIIHNNDIIIK